MFEYHHPSIGESLRRLFAEVIRIWPKFICLKVLKIIFENPDCQGSVRLRQPKMRARKMIEAMEGKKLPEQVLGLQ